MSPKTAHNCNSSCGSFIVRIGDYDYYTNEVLEDDGTYGESAEYFYWWDVRGQYYQYYVTGGAIPIISNTPISFPTIIMNMEVQHQGASPAVPTPAPPSVQGK